MMSLSAADSSWRHLARATLTAAALTLGLAACGPSDSNSNSGGETTGETNTGETSTGGADDGKVVYHRGNFAEPTSMDPHRFAGTWESHIGRDLYLGLMTDAADASPVYGAAESHELSEDGLTWTFTIRENHNWSDGTPVTAHDFVFAFQRICDPVTGAEYCPLLEPIQNSKEIYTGQMDKSEMGVTAIDDRTLEIRLQYPAPYLPQLLTHQASYPVPKHLVEEHGSEWVRQENFASNGAYTLEEWRPNNYVKLVKNPEFYDRDNVAIDVIYFYPTDNSLAAVTRFENGELDSNNDFPIQQLDRLKAEFPEQTRIHPYLTTTYAIFNTIREPFTNKDLRMAMAMAVDRVTLAEKVMKTGQQPAYNLIPPGILNYPGTAAFEWKDMSMEDRIAAAQDLMRKAGYGPDNRLQIIYRHREGNDNRRRAVAMADMWKKIWVDAQLQNTETKTHYADLRSGNFQIADAGWVADYNDPKNFLFLLDSKTGQLNYGNYNNPEFDSLLATSDRTVDLEERGALLAQAEQIMLNDAPMIPVLFDTSRNLVADHLIGWVDNVDDRHPTRWMSIDESKRRQR